MPDRPMEKSRPHPWSGALRERAGLVLCGDGAGGVGARGDEREGSDGVGGGADGAVPFAELCLRTNFTFLDGASHPDEYVRRASELGHAAAAVADTNSLGGAVRAHAEAERLGVPLAVGAHVRAVFSEDAFGSDVDGGGGLDVWLYPCSRGAYAQLSGLLTDGKCRSPKGACWLTVHDVLERVGAVGGCGGFVGVVMPGCDVSAEPMCARWLEVVRMLRGAVVGGGGLLGLAAVRRFGVDDRRHLGLVEALGAEMGLPLVASSDAAYHCGSRKPLRDVLTCIRLGTTLERAGRALEPNAERCLKPGAEMSRLLRCFDWGEDAVRRAGEWALEASSGFSLSSLRYEYPREVCPRGMSPRAYLRELAWAGAAKRYPGGVPERVRRQIEHELGLIAELGYEAYFLTVRDIVRFARSRGILCQGRGAAANSAVCYCLEVTAVDPDRIDVLFERFVSKERDEPPDIDVDFEHDRREEVIQHVYERFGRDRAALASEVVTYRGRSAVREVGKALGLSLDAVDRVAKNLDRWDSGDSWRLSVEEKEQRRLPGNPAVLERMREAGLRPDDATVRRLVHLVSELRGFPRHRSQHVGGFVISETPLWELVPIENAAMDDRTVIEWDKDDIEALGMLKVDCLGLGMLSAIRRSFELVNGWDGAVISDGVDRDELESRALACGLARAGYFGGGVAGSVGCGGSGGLELHTVPAEDGRVYEMICEADTVGVFQIESRAQMSMLPRLKPGAFYDLVIEVAIVRPGPIQGDMVHPYLRRRDGLEVAEYPSETVREILGKTLGVPLFQEQAMSLAIRCAGFSAGEADRLRRAIAAWKAKSGVIETFGRRIVEGMAERGYERAFAERCFSQLRGFSEYGFPESHAASFAHLVYVSCYLKRFYPAAFCAALLNSQPMGFYAPAQLVKDAERHGVRVLPVDVNCSLWDCVLEGDGYGEGVWGDVGSSDGAAWGRGGPAVRLGLRMVKGLGEADGRALVAERERGGRYGSLDAVLRRSGVGVSVVRTLARADGFGSLGLTRQTAMWHARSLRDEPLPLFDGRFGGCGDGGGGGGGSSGDGEWLREEVYEAVGLPGVARPREILSDYERVGLSLRGHPMDVLRGWLDAEGVVAAADLSDEVACPAGRWVEVAGVVLIRQRPGTASGIVFMTLEDETGVANLIVRPSVFERCRAAARHATVVRARGRVEREGKVVHVQTVRLEDVTERALSPEARSRDFH